jgi:hypothetical protein
MIAPFLIHVDFSKTFVLEMNTSNFAIGVIFSQLRNNYFFHPIGFCFHNFFLAEINYEIHDKKLLTIIDAFEEWHH